MMLVGIRRGQESDTEIAFITDHAAKWAYEKDKVKDALPESFSSGLVVSVTPATRTNRGLIKVRHGYISRSCLESDIVHPNSAIAKRPARSPNKVGQASCVGAPIGRWGGRERRWQDSPF